MIARWLLCWLLWAPAALAHGGHAPAPGWTFDPWVIGSLTIAGGAYALGVRRLWRRAGHGRAIRMRHAASYAAGLAVLVVALLSPVDGLSDQLQWMHMIQHMLIMMVAAPLMVLGSPAIALLWALPERMRRGVGTSFNRAPAIRRPWYWLWQPAATWALFALTLWVWHWPRLYEAALASDGLHHLQHLGFFAASAVFWRVLLDPLSRLRLSPVLGVIYLFGTSLHATLLGVFMALAPGLWYPYYATTTQVWRLTPMEDQQLAGLIMWMPACAVYALVAAVIVALWLGRREEDHA